MGRPLKVLIIDDNEPDAILIANELKENGFDMLWLRVDSPEALKHELRAKEWDIIISDYVLPSFSAMDALSIVSDEKVDVPFIVVSGVLNEDIAPELIKAGANDYISKDELPKLAAAVEREVCRVVKEVERKISEEEKKLSLTEPAIASQPYLSIRKRFFITFGIIVFIVLLYSSFMASKWFNDAENMSFEKASGVAGAVSAAIADFLLDNGAGTARSGRLQEYIRDLRNTSRYDVAFLTPDGAVLAGYESFARRMIKNNIDSGVKKTMADGITRKISVYSSGWIKEKFLLTKVSNPAGKTSGVVVIDYTGDYANFIKYNLFQGAAALVILLAVLAVILAAGHITAKAVVEPISDIKTAIERIAGGDLVTRVDIKKFDEIGSLARSFDAMREKLKETVDKLKAEINDRHLAEQALQSLHLKLTRWVGELDKRTHEITLLNQMGKMLQSCKTVDEFHTMTMRYAEQLFPDEHGAVYMFNDSGKFMEAVCMWGKEPIEHSFSPEDCWALRGGHIYTADAPDNPNMLCNHIRARAVDKNLVQTICVPMMAQGEIIGMFHIRNEQTQALNGNINVKRRYAREQLVGAVAEHVSLALSNLKLQDSLRQQSIHDPLTGLFNRRYMKESLEREIYRARRHNVPFGVIMMDIDYFKKFNDEYGHDIGDMVLERIGKVIKMAIRPEDIPCRYGGEEFLIVLPGAAKEGTNQCASRILNETRKIKIKSKGESFSGVTMSLGASAFPYNGDSIEQVVKAADNALMDAKRSGRDCIILSSEAAAKQVIQ